MIAGITMKNGEGYHDPTAGKAVALMRERKSALVVLQAMLRYADKHGYEVVGELRLKNKQTGRVWR
ncbi:MAG: hypothetical protein IJ510_01615 [Selenomonadales bacterium]|nr:hypothetical protein [Selenomonadales bacterium]